MAASIQDFTPPQSAGIIEEQFTNHAPQVNQGLIFIDPRANSASLGQPALTFIKTTAVPILGIIMVLILTYAGFLYLISGANQKQRDTAKSIVKSVAISFFIILFAYTIVEFFFGLQSLFAQ